MLEIHMTLIGIVCRECRSGEWRIYVHILHPTFKETGIREQDKMPIYNWKLKMDLNKGCVKHPGWGGGVDERIVLMPTKKMIAI